MLIVVCERIKPPSGLCSLDAPRKPMPFKSGHRMSKHRNVWGQTWDELQAL